MHHFVHLVHLPLLVVVLITTPVQGDEHTDETGPGRLLLDVYLDEDGKALMIGYADNLDGLEFLESSEYIYGDETTALYVLTGSLTSMIGDCWELELVTRSCWDEYLVVFYLPPVVVLEAVDGSEGLEYLVAESAGHVQK
ncbi:hypothetical protein D4R47_01425 [archaeon]|nr:MAG: hypothetical protein D4R47_01425 [archaeon]